MVIAVDEPPDHLDAEAVRLSGGQVQVGQRGDRAGAVVGSERQVVRVGQFGYPSRLADAAGPGEVDQHDVSRLLAQDLPEGEARYQPFADRLRDPGLPHQPGQVLGAVGLANILRPENADRFDGRQILIAMLTSQRLWPSRSSSKEGRRGREPPRARTARWPGRSGSGSSLPAPSPTSRPARSTLGCELRARTGPRATLSSRSSPRSRSSAASAAGSSRARSQSVVRPGVDAGVVGRDHVTAGTTEQLVDGQPGHLAEGVPKRHVQGGQGAHFRPGEPEEVGARKERRPQLRKWRRPARPRKQRRRQVMYYPLDGSRQVVGLAEPDDPGGGVDPRPQQVRLR